jgi:hypothetical protein
LRELALHLLDIAENSVAAQASHITLTVVEDFQADRLTLRVEDNGKGMDALTAQRAVDPFYTSRTTRKVGLGIPLLKAAAEACDGGLNLHSQVGGGTVLEATFRESHIDRMPLGNLADTCFTLIIGHPEIYWKFLYRSGDYEFIYDHGEILQALDGVSLTEPAVLQFLRNTIEMGMTVPIREPQTIH